MEKEKKKVTIIFYGEGTRIDVRDENDDLIDSYMYLRDVDIDNIELEGNTRKELSTEDLGKPLNEIWDQDDPEYKESYFESIPNLYHPCEVYENVGRIVWIMSKTCAFVKIELEDGEKFDPKKLRLLTSEVAYPGGELEVICGALYNGKEDPLQFDLDGDDEKGWEDLWSIDDDE